MKITKIAEQVKTRGRYSIYIDDKFAFGISELGLIDNALRIGMEFSKQGLNDLAEKAEADKYYNMAIGLIARRPRSAWEIDFYLKRKELDEPTRQSIINKLASRNFIDDRNFAERWVENRRILKPVSYRKLRIELLQKHVSDSIISEVLAEDSTDELDVLKAEIARKQKQTRYQDETKLLQYLARQGYSYGDIKQVLSEAKER